jgi:GT2 family glycosyltransferase
MIPNSITVVVPTLGTRPAWLEDCLQSIKTQDRANSRTIVVAPSAADLRVCDKFDIEVARFDSKGLSSAVNYGWSLDPTSSYISWLGDDDLLAPESLTATSSFLDRYPRCSMVYGRVRYIDAEDKTLLISRPTRFAAPYLRFGKNFVSQQGSLIRRAAAAKVGYLDTQLVNAMDQDLFTRLRDAGPRAYLPRELGAFRWHSAGITSLKGPLDESELVRQRYWSEQQLRWYRAWRVCGRRFDWASVAVMRRLPAPAVPLREGRPYTESGAVRMHP